MHKKHKPEPWPLVPREVLREKEKEYLGYQLPTGYGSVASRNGETVKWQSLTTQAW